MKRADLIRHLTLHRCVFVREGGKHTVYRNPETGSTSTVPRHREIKKQLVRKICNDLGIPTPVYRWRSMNACIDWTEGCHIRQALKGRQKANLKTSH